MRIIIIHAVASGCLKTGNPPFGWLKWQTTRKPGNQETATTPCSRRQALRWWTKALGSRTTLAWGSADLLREPYGGKSAVVKGNQRETEAIHTYACTHIYIYIYTSPVGLNGIHHCWICFVSSRDHRRYVGGWKGTPWGEVKYMNSEQAAKVSKGTLRFTSTFAGL